MTVSREETAKLLAVLQAARQLEKSRIAAVRNYASHTLVETRCILDQLLIVPPESD